MSASSLSSLSSLSSSGEYGAHATRSVEQRWHLLLDCLEMAEKRVIRQTTVRMWREVQIWAAIEGTIWNYQEILTEDAIWKMLQDRPKPCLAPWKHYNHKSDIPSDFVGHVCVKGKWYHES